MAKANWRVTLLCWGTVGWRQALTMGHHNQGGLLGSGPLAWAHQDGIKVQAPCGGREGSVRKQ